MTEVYITINIYISNIFNINIRRYSEFPHGREIAPYILFSLKNSQPGHYTFFPLKSLCPVDVWWFSTGLRSSFSQRNFWVSLRYRKLKQTGQCWERFEAQISSCPIQSPGIRSHQLGGCTRPNSYLIILSILHHLSYSSFLFTKFKPSCSDVEPGHNSGPQLQQPRYSCWRHQN